MEISEIFTKEKKANNMTFREISMRCGIADGRLCDIFKGNTDCGMKTARRIALAMNMKSIPIE